MGIRATRTAAAAFLVGALAGCAPADPPPAQPHVILITLDTTRADRLGVYGYGRPTSPRLDEMARHSLVFERAWSTSTWTLPAHASLFTGKLPKSHGARYDPDGPLVLGRHLDGPEDWSEIRARGVAESEVSLAGLLAGAGYRTGAVVAGPWMKRVFGLDAGFEHYDDSGIETLNGRRAQSVTNAALAWLDTLDGAPFFLFLNYYDAHTPLLPPWEFVEQVVPPGERPRGKATTPAQMSGLYDAEIRYADLHFGRLLDGLRERGLYDRSWIAVTADHGELLGEHGATGHGRSLFEPELRVPLVVKPATGGPRPQRRTEPVQLHDVFTMVLERVGVALPAGTQGGRGQPVVAEVYPLPRLSPGGGWRALIEGPYKYLESTQGVRLLFDLERDPGESDDLSQREPERAAALGARLDAYLASLPDPPAAGPVRDVDPETREALESLGYLE